MCVELDNLGSPVGIMSRFTHISRNYSVMFL